MIILEGPDNSGKTELSKQLARLLGANVIHSTQPEGEVTSPEAFEHHRAQMVDGPIIRDRVFAISEVIYGTVLRQDVRLGQYQNRAMNEVLSGGHLIIYCRPKDQTILVKNGRSHSSGVKENHLRIINFYDIFMKQWERYAQGSVVITYDWENPAHLPELLKLVELYWRDKYENN